MKHIKLSILVAVLACGICGAAFAGVTFCRARQAVSVTAATITTPKPLMLVAAARGMATPHAQAAWF